MLWNRLLGLNSFIIWPATGILLVYAIGRAILHGEWQLLGIAAALFGLEIIVQVVLAILSD